MSEHSRPRAREKGPCSCSSKRPGGFSKGPRGEDRTRQLLPLRPVCACRVVLYGELAPECAYTYFKYGTALFYKAQEDADVMGGDNAVKAAAEAKKEKLAGEKGSGSEPGSSSKTGEDKEAQSSSAGKADRDAPAALPDRKGE